MLADKSEYSQELATFIEQIYFCIDIVYIEVYNQTVKCSAEDGKMGISYKKLWLILVEKEISPATLRKDLNIATGTMTKLRRNEEVALSVLLRICEYLDCNIGDICDAVRTYLPTI